MLACEFPDEDLMTSLRQCWPERGGRQGRGRKGGSVVRDSRRRTDLGYSLVGLDGGGWNGTLHGGVGVMRRFMGRFVGSDWGDTSAAARRRDEKQRQRTQSQQ